MSLCFVFIVDFCFSFNYVHATVYGYIEFCLFVLLSSCYRLSLCLLLFLCIFIFRLYLLEFPYVLFMSLFMS